MQEELRAVEGALRTPPADGPPIEQLKMQQEALPRRIAQALAKLQRATADEASLSADLGNEQARWTDLNQRMEALEATLAPR
jgi:chromosome segregation ATPase